MLKIENLSIAYGLIEVINQTSLEIQKGEFATLFGRNGAGKTSLLKAIAGLLLPKEGRLFFEGKEITNLPPWERVKMGLALVPEGRKVFTSLLVKENLELGAFTCCRPKEVRKRLEVVLELFPSLKDRLKLQAGLLSGGEQQMLAIARALMSQPKLLLLDEPSMGLAPKVVNKIFESLAKLKGSLTLLVVEQNISRSLKLADRVFVLDSGRLIRLDSKEANFEIIEKAYLGKE